MHEIKATGYPKPKQLSDPYGEFGAEQKEIILHKDGAFLNARELTALFNGSVSAGTYDESVHYLPDVTRFLAAHYWESVHANDADFDELFHKFFRWTAYYCDFLAKDGIWDDLNRYLSDLFALATGRFELCGKSSPGFGLVECFFTYFGHGSFLQKHDPLGVCKNFPFGVTEEYMARRFEHPASYVDHAWLILLVNGSCGLTGCYGINDIHDSAFLEKLRNDAAWRAAAVTAVIAETEARPELTDYWSACLDYGMFF